MMRETQGPVFVVHVSRPAEVEQTWKDLPIIMMEQEIMETQLSSHLPYEASFGSKQVSSGSVVIGITQPHRVAVLASRH
ncbi:hypothetical protein Bca52824_059934 [Brassica carinata]|uniref:Uncharacterized protein n=1 Tax=Brassica carinata TaxID=52824 RepID=A0A8X7UG69_BRACI|nr:hypothetical protein Bca52824_059934 [Brassica carinata]